MFKKRKHKLEHVSLTTHGCRGIRTLSMMFSDDIDDHKVFSVVLAYGSTIEQVDDQLSALLPGDVGEDRWT